MHFFLTELPKMLRNFCIFVDVHIQCWTKKKKQISTKLNQKHLMEWLVKIKLFQIKATGNFYVLVFYEMSIYQPHTSSKRTNKYIIDYRAKLLDLNLQIP